MATSDDDLIARLLAGVLRRAEANVADGGGPFAAAVVRGTDVLAEGVNRVTRDTDPTAHAEVVAIRAACRSLGDFSLAGSVLLSSCEPCPMCLASALWSRVDRIVYAADRHDAARAGFDDLEFYELLDRPRGEWPVPVVQQRLAGAGAPFAAWVADAGRQAY